ncbi:MAG: hypothetical protein J6V99_08810 [Neisseriaceae bacterium]|nr:hypothetical protein [Neisseriaceae bacterium]
MKKTIISVLVGAILGGVGVLATTQTTQLNSSENAKSSSIVLVAEAKGLPEKTNNEVATEDTVEICNPNKVLEKNKKFYFNNAIFNIKKRTISELEFELTYKNEKTNTPFVFKGVAKRNGCDGEYYIDDEPFAFPDHDDNSEYGLDDGITGYTYENNNCYLSIGRLNSNESGLIIEDVKECKALKETGFNDTFIAIAQYE